MINPQKAGVAATAACHTLVHMLELTYGVVLIGISLEFDASLLAMGIVANIFGLAFGFMALPSGVLADRSSERNLLIVCASGMTAAAVGIGLSPNIYALGAGLLVLGLAMGIFHPVASAFVARVATRRGMGFGYMGIGGNLGLALGPLVAGLTASAFNWRVSYFVLAAPALILTVLFALTKPDRPADTPPPETAATGRARLGPVVPLLGLLFAIQVFNGLIYRGLVTFLPLHLSEGLKLGFLRLDAVMIAGSFTTFALVFGIGGQFLGGHLAERWRRERLAMFVAALVFPLLLAVGNTTGFLLIAAATSLAFFHFMGQPIYNTLVADYTPQSWRGRIYGIYFFCSFGVGSFSASLLGYFATMMGTNWVFNIAAIFGVLAFICAVFLLREAVRRTTTP
ncbi:MAG: MFS transporter [Dehalococcoidia bacterium]|nr:MAG: MFS transporter [Dehalococcoidia bacterium]